MGKSETSAGSNSSSGAAASSQTSSGPINVGNSCYAKAIFQALAAMVALAPLVQTALADPEPVSLPRLIDALRQGHTADSVLWMNQLFEDIKSMPGLTANQQRIAQSFSGERQEDPTEFFFILKEYVWPAMQAAFPNLKTITMVTCGWHCCPL